MQHPNGNLRSPQHAHTNSMQIPKRARCRETLSDLVGRVFSLDIAFYRTRLQENNLAAVRIPPERYAEAVGHMPFVASIAITPIAKG